ncbi:MAG TPA: hypothetical protein VFP55_06065 [Solirubrobacteraceae bacterium]|nr:hypothetical protein [Solirubrobacteraceae bacterium]
MAEVVIRLERPAMLTPELRAWISHRLGAGRAVLTRGRLNGSERGSLLLRVQMTSVADAVDEEVAELMTDLRLLGLRPTLVSEQVA